MNTEEEARSASSTGVAPERREFRRTQEYRPSELQVCLTETDGQQHPMRALLWDFGQGGLRMDIPRPLLAGEEVSVSGELRGADYSVAFRALARVAHCRQIDQETYRVGVGFLDITYRRPGEPSFDTSS